MENTMNYVYIQVTKSGLDRVYLRRFLEAFLRSSHSYNIGGYKTVG